ncbi:MAG: hypothetical protein KGP28_02370 [Bdellovibrionales bacterium]|nr:hypothetical protein [Bdellovibrionales bacterium]
MKIKGWIIIAALAIAGTASRSLGADSQTAELQESFAELERAIQATKDTAAQERNLHWPEIERFQADLWRAMALDPSVIAPVPANEVPKELFAAELNAALLSKLEEIKKSPLPKQWGVEAEFSQYLVTVQEIMNLRKGRLFPQARAIAKRGFLDNKFEPISKKIAPVGASPSAPGTSWVAVEESMKSMKEAVQTRDSFKREFFGAGNGGSNNFFWVFVVAFFGFLLGVGATRLSPGFFQKFDPKLQTTVPSATTHSAGTQPLDYARWLKEFEEILIRLKSTQLSHERRIEDIVINSEKITQQLNGLASDARIKNEASLEYRMGSVLRAMQGQFELSQKLQGGDRAQINVMLEHCLSLCDAIEAGSLNFDQTAPL